MKRGYLPILMTFLLIFGLGTQFWAKYKNASRAQWRGPTLGESWRINFGSLDSDDIPLAGSAEEWDAIKGGLNFSDYIFKKLRTPAGDISIYMASWAANTMAPRLVQTHTPDVCWTRVGWKIKSANAYTIDYNGKAWVVAERVFVSEGEGQNVIFWHILGGESFTYGRVGNIPWWAVFTDLFKYGTKLNSAHVFVRISSRDSLTDVLNTAQGRKLFEWALNNSYNRTMRE